MQSQSHKPLRSLQTFVVLMNIWQHSIENGESITEKDNIAASIVSHGRRSRVGEHLKCYSKYNYKQSL